EVTSLRPALRCGTVDPGFRRGDEDERSDPGPPDPVQPARLAAVRALWQNPPRFDRGSRASVPGRSGLMQIGVIGLGRMGANISRRLMRAGHDCVVFDVDVQARETLAQEGAKVAGSLAELAQVLADKPRALWVMLPAGRTTEETIAHLGRVLEA